MTSLLALAARSVADRWSSSTVNLAVADAAALFLARQAGSAVRVIAKIDRSRRRRLSPQRGRSAGAADRPNDIVAAVALGGGRRRARAKPGGRRTPEAAAALSRCVDLSPLGCRQLGYVSRLRHVGVLPAPQTADELPRWTPTLASAAARAALPFDISMPATCALRTRMRSDRRLPRQRSTAVATAAPRCRNGLRSRVRIARAHLAGPRCFLARHPTDYSAPAPPCRSTARTTLAAPPGSTALALASSLLAVEAHARHTLPP